MFLAFFETQMPALRSTSTAGNPCLPAYKYLVVPLHWMQITPAAPLGSIPGLLVAVVDAVAREGHVPVSSLPSTSFNQFDQFQRVKLINNLYEN